jgi:hypothetical protein
VRRFASTSTASSTSATVVAVTDKEVINLFQDGLYHHRTFEDCGRCRPSSITKLKDMITSWADEQDKANAMYDSIRSKRKNNTGGNNNNDKDHGGRNNNNYSGPNRNRKTNNIVIAIQRPTKHNSKNPSSDFRHLLKEKRPWHLDGNHTTEQCYQLRRALQGYSQPMAPSQKERHEKSRRRQWRFQGT